ncbi:hypothetical protein V5P93_004569 [Actinokineospora auranticolor]|uniref:CATRA-Associated Small Protein domain-containing protein n=1 Tax=Actinokineospora auranticolor TaxID=155976 RepID=A0A2S6GSU7_9PSEU|nr:CATRA system-associated protein [Actinokineospora auranticolor]PPK68325.1 hypothetical protein CLV40_10548 [Actinokineospora auranticolor]
MLDGEPAADARAVLGDLRSWLMTHDNWTRITALIHQLAHHIATNDTAAAEQVIAELESYSPLRLTRITHDDGGSAPPETLEASAEVVESLREDPPTPNVVP